MTLRSSDLQSDSDLDSIRNSCDDNDNDNNKLNEWMKTRQNKIVTQCQNCWAHHLFSLTLDGVDVRKEGNSRQSPHLLNENRILCIQYELSCWGEKTFLLIPIVTKPGWQLQILSKKTFQCHSFRKNLTDVTLVWGDCQHSTLSVPIKSLIS